MDLNEQALEVATEAFHQEYRKALPAGADEYDHDCATREGVAAAIEAYHAAANKDGTEQHEWFYKHGGQS